MNSTSRQSLNTPASENTVYFDAQSHFSMQANEQEHPPSTSIYTSYTPPVSTNYNDSGARNDYLGPLHVSQYEQDDNNAITHPNGSQEWLPAVNFQDVEPPASDTLNNPHSPPRTSSASPLGGASYPGPDTQTNMIGVSSLNRAASKRSTFTNSEGRPIAGSTFINGAGTTGPHAAAEHDETLHARSASAENSLTPKQKSKIVKQEARDNKQLSKIIKKEGKAEKQALSLAIKELADLQRFQDAAVKHEAKVHAAHAKVLASFKKAEAIYLAAKTEYETSLARLNAHEEALDKIREGAREATERVQQKSQEVDGLRTMLGVDERERQAKLAELSQGRSRWGLLRN